MILKRGITGFFDVGDCPLAENDYSAFKQVCYSIRAKNRELLDICRPNNTNYFYAQFTSDGQNFYVLLNKYYPVIAFTNELTFMNKAFVDFTEISSYFTGYDMVRAEVLNARFTNIEHDLSKAETEQIKYWEPISIGNIIFNEWD